MNKKGHQLKDVLKLSNGLEFDIDEGWRKLISSQFGGNPGRAFGELIQNLLDSYPAAIAWENRKGDIETNGKMITITDYGEGMDLNRLRLIVTLGGTDKRGDKNKIGQFGIGFFSIFNPKLGTKQVRVTTMCEGRAVELVFKVERPNKRPIISSRILEKDLSFSTQIEVVFTNKASVDACLEYAAKVLTFYPCTVAINSQSSKSIWQEAKASGGYIFEEKLCHGIIKPGSSYNWVTLLCKYEHITNGTLGSLSTGGHDMTWNLQDYHRGQMPVLQDINVIINCNDLIVTISRDSFFLELAYMNMINTLSKHLLLYLGRILNRKTDPEIILANQYTLRKKVKSYLQQRQEQQIDSASEEQAALKKLAETKVYRLAGRKMKYSLWELFTMKKRGNPLYFSPEQTNLRWLGGVFKHDFIVVPQRVSLRNGAPGFYDQLFGEIFEDIVNLDTIQEDDDKLKSLVDRNIIDKGAFSPKYSFVGHRDLTKRERIFLMDLGNLLSCAPVKNAIAGNVYIPIRTIQTAFFELTEGNKMISSGLFHEKGEILGEMPANMVSQQGQSFPSDPREPQDLVVGIRRDHPVVVHLLHSQDRYRIYYTLTFLAHELALCQKLLIPFSPFYHMVKDRLSTDMRDAMIENLLENGQSQDGSHCDA